MQRPSRNQIIYSHILGAEIIVETIRDGYLNSLEYDLEVISDLDKARVFLKCALNKLEKNEEK